MTMTDPEYTPPPVDGYVFYSNFGTTRYGNPEINTIQSLSEYISQHLNIPISDVLVTDFDKHPLVKFASYIKEQHKAIVEERDARLERGRLALMIAMILDTLSPQTSTVH